MNGIQIPPEWFLESPGRNQFPERGRTESLLKCCLLIMSKSSVGVRQGSIWASSTNNSTLSHHHHRPRRLPTSLTTVTNGHHQPRRIAWTPPTTSTARPKRARTTQQRHVTTQSSQTSAWNIPQQCHVAVSDVANDERRHQSSFVVFVPGEYSPPIPLCSTFAREEGATSLLSATWQPNGERRLRSSFT